MTESVQKIVEILSLLRSDSISYQDNPRKLLDKYNLMFLGDKANTIFTNDLIITINDYFHMNISNNVLQELIPEACEILHMKYEPMKALNDMNNPIPHCYQIVLW